jgi:hypothetical protein
MNTIYLRRCRKVHVKPGAGGVSPKHLAALQKNIESLGFVLSEALLARLETLSVERLGSFYKSLVKDLRELTGAHRDFTPMYPNFPEQVMQLSEASLYLNAIRHYLTNLRPSYDKQSRPPLRETVDLQVVDLGSREDFENLFTRLASSRTSLSAQDKNDIAWFAAQYRDDLARLLPAEVPVKENLAVIGAQLMRLTNLTDSWLDERIQSATDVLRLAVALSDGDVSLAEPTRFVTFRRRERRRMLRWIERCAEPTGDMLRWKERWKRLGERLHPREFEKRFPKAAASFDTLRNNGAYVTFNGRIEERLRDRDVAGALELLIQRPGELTRRLDHLLRLDGNAEGILSAFERIADTVSTPVLLQTLTHFAHRDRPQSLRIFFPKGDVAKVQAIANRLRPLPPGSATKAAAICETTLLARFASLPPLGKCYLDPALADYLVPFSQRSAAKSLRTLVRGSKVPLPDGNVVRFFLWWKNGTSRTDIDLSAVLFDAEFNYFDVVSYYNLKNFGGHHSGDIVNAPEGAAEFIDLDIERTRSGGVRYVVMSLNSFTEQPYCDLPECFAGWMSRKHANSGEIFEPRAVQDKVDVAANTRICIPSILDLQNRQALWADIALRKQPRWNNVESNLSGVSLMLRALTSLVKTDLYALFDLHIKARGERTLDKNSADSVFAVRDGITPFDLDRIAAEFMG